jgi:hypothetical protein
MLEGPKIRNPRLNLRFQSDPRMTLMQSLRAKFLMTIISTIVTLQILNISFDAVDPNLGREDLSINDIESCVEFILEVVLDKPNAIEETDDQDEDSSKPATSIVLFLITKVWVIEDKGFETLESRNFSYSQLSIFAYSPSIVGPPPKVV